MEFEAIVRRRRMARHYDGRDIERATLERIIELARHHPSAGFTQGQYLVVITEAETRNKVAALCDEPGWTARGFAPWISSAPALVVVCTSEGDYHRRYSEPDKIGGEGKVEWPIPYWWVDVGACLQSLLLAAVDAGLDAGFFGFHRTTGLNELLDIPEEVQPIGIVTLGHASGEQPMGSARRGWRPLGDVVHWERWGGNG